MPLFAGFDTSEKYPGDDAMRYLYFETELYFVGVYLAVEDKKDKSRNAVRQSWVGTCKFLRTTGWNVVPIYMGKQHDLSTITSALKMSEGTRATFLRDEGKKDGEEAIRLAREFGYGCTIYFDVENPFSDPKRTAAYLQYYKAWASALRSHGYSPGVYCHRDMSFPDADYFWIVQPLGRSPVTPGKKNLQGMPNAYNLPDPKSTNDDRTIWQFALEYRLPYLKKEAGGKIYGYLKTAAGKQVFPLMRSDINVSYERDPAYPSDYGF